jgi:hypothetical protein
MTNAQYVPYQGHRSRRDSRSASWSYPAGISRSSEHSLQATPFVYRRPETLPRRQWLYGRQYIRRFVSGTVAAGGMGKSALALVEAIAMATGRDLLGHRPRGKYRVWYINGEDPRDEIDRRIGGILLRYGISPEEIEGHLFVDSGRDRDFTLVETTRNGVEVREAVCQDIEAQIKANSIDVLIIDPLISALRISENDNNAMDVAIKRLARIAENCNCAVEILHHTRKAPPNANSTEPSIDDARGASSFGGAVRVGRVLRRMTSDEAAKAAVDNHEQFFRAHRAKANMSPRLDRNEWYELQSVDLRNGTAEELSDHVGVVTRWEWPNLCEELGQHDLYRIQKVVSEGPSAILEGDHDGWRRDPQAIAWVGKAVANVLGINLDDSKPRIKAMLDIWIASGALRVIRREDRHRKSREFVEVGEWMPSPSEACATLQNGSGAMVEQVEQW